MAGNRRISLSKPGGRACWTWNLLTSGSEEHQRRSPDCVFFTQSQILNAKRARGRKGRLSKASRTSMQSTLTGCDEDLSMIEAPGEDGDSVATTVTNTNMKSAKLKTAIKGGKGKKSKGKGESKVENPLHKELVPESSFVEPEDDDFEVKVTQSPVSRLQRRKRSSDEMEVDDPLEAAMDRTRPTSWQDLPAKRRTTRARSSAVKSELISHCTAVEQIDDDTHMIDNDDVPTITKTTSKKGAKVVRKTASSTARKTSNISTASKASLRGMPIDEELDVALEADLDRPLTDDEEENQGPPKQEPNTRRLTRTRPTSEHTPASIAHVRETARVSDISADVVAVEVRVGIFESSRNDVDHVVVDARPQDENIVRTKQKLEGKKRTTKKGVCTTSKPAVEQESVVIDPDVADSHDAAMVNQDADIEVTESAEIMEQVIKTAPYSVLATDSLKSKKNTKISTEPMKLRGRQPSRHILGRGRATSILSAAEPSPEPNISLRSSMIQPEFDGDDHGYAIGDEEESEVKVEHSKNSAKSLRKRKLSKTLKAFSTNIENGVPTSSQTGIMEQPTVETDLHIQEVQQEVPIKLSAPMVDIATSPNRALAAADATKAEIIILPKLKTGRGRPRGKGAATKTSISLQQVELTSELPMFGADSQAAATCVPTELPFPLPRNLTTFTPTIQPPKLKAPTPSPTPSPQSSDAENQPPSSRPSQKRPPLFETSPSRPPIFRVALAPGTPNTPPLDLMNASRMQTTFPWTSVDLESIIFVSPNACRVESHPFAVGAKGDLTSPEKKMTVEQWILYNARKGEENLREECESMVGKFEGEGNRALKALEGIICEG